MLVVIDGNLLACVAGAWKLWAKERTGPREGDTRGVVCIMHCVCFYLKLIIRLSRFRIMVTHTKLKIKTSFKNTT